jgi:hypothetical protein
MFRGSTNNHEQASGIYPPEPLAAETLLAAMESLACSLVWINVIAGVLMVFVWKEALHYGTENSSSFGIDRLCGDCRRGTISDLLRGFGEP